MTGKFKELMGGRLTNCSEWDNCDDLYDKFLSQNITIQKIPKKIHQIWIGTIPDYVYELSEGIKNIHVDWDYKLWTLQDLETYPMINRESFNTLKNLGAKSDIARYEILLNEGGIYMDSDFDMVKNFEPLLCNDFFTGSGEIEDPEVFNGLIGCSPNHPLMNVIVNGLSNVSEDGDPMSTTGPYYFSKCFFEYIKNNMNEDIVSLPGPYFYPLSRHKRFEIRNNHNIMKEFIHSFDTDETYCTHLWYNSWL